MAIEIGSNAPLFELPAVDGTVFKLVRWRGDRTLLVFYPDDETPVCTAQLCEYRHGLECVSALGVEVIGISPDSAASHQRFKTRRALPFTLLSDTDLSVARAYGAAGMAARMFHKFATAIANHCVVARFAPVCQLNVEQTTPTLPNSPRTTPRRALGALATQAYKSFGLGMKRAVYLLDQDQTVRYAHVEALALFRRSADELLAIIAKLPPQQIQNHS